MSKNTSLSLGEHFSNFVETRVLQCQYSSASSVPTGPSLLEAQETKLDDASRAGLIEAEQSGPSTPFDFDDFIATKQEAQPQTP